MVAGSEYRWEAREIERPQGRRDRRPWGRAIPMSAGTPHTPVPASPAEQGDQLDLVELLGEGNRRCLAAIVSDETIGAAPWPPAGFRAGQCG